MLSDDAIEKLMQPIIDRQENINNYVLKIIADRIKQTGKLSPSDVYKLERLWKTGSDIRKIKKELARLTGLQVRDIQRLIRDVAKDGYLDMRPFYTYRKMQYIPFESNIALQSIVKAIAKETADAYTNLSKTSAIGFMLRDRKNSRRMKFQPISDAYVSVIDEAVQIVATGTEDYETAIQRTLQQLIDKGLTRVVYSPESGRKYTLQLDTAVRRLVLDGVRAINQGVQDEVGKQIGADGKELSAHPYSAPDHEPFQGRQFTNKEYAKLQNNKSFKDINGVKYEAVKRVIGQWNCRHFAWSIILGITKPIYTEQQLKDMAAANAKGYTLSNGKHLSMYECTQRQRQMEDEIRKTKRGQMIAEESGNDKLANKYKAKAKRLTKEYNAFSKDCGLMPKRAKLKVAG